MSEDFMELFTTALAELEKEKGIPKEVLLEAIETALISAYKRGFGASQNARVVIDENTGEVKVFAEKEVIDDVFDDSIEVSLEDARKVNPAYEIGDKLEVEVTPQSFGRIAAQTAKQVVMQKIRDAERGVIFDEFSRKEGEAVSATISRAEKTCIYLEIGRAEGVMPITETIPGEKYLPGQRLKVYVLEVKNSTKGAQIIVSRSHPSLIKRLFELEVPEIHNNIVLIKSIAREAGYRSKMAVSSEEQNIDPVGACVGPKGTRIEKVVTELCGEKVDIIPWNSDPSIFISNALRPAKAILVQVHAEEKAAKVIVPDYQLSLAIGKEGQNVRLAAKLTGYKIDIKSQSQMVDNIFGQMPDLPEEDTEDYGYSGGFDYPDMPPIDFGSLPPMYDSSEEEPNHYYDEDNNEEK